MFASYNTSLQIAKFHRSLSYLELSRAGTHGSQNTKSIYMGASYIIPLCIEWDVCFKL